MKQIFGSCIYTIFITCGWEKAHSTFRIFESYTDMKYALFLTAFAALASGTSEKNFGLRTIRFILPYYHDHLTALQVEFGVNIRRYLENIEKTASIVSKTFANCVHEGAAPVETQLVEKVNEMLGQEEDKIIELLKSLDNLNDEEVDKLWTSVSKDGTYRNQMNAMITGLKKTVLQGLTNFKKVISTKCTPMTEQITLNRILG